MAELYTNDPSTTLNVSMGSGDTSLTVVSSTGFPGGGNFRIRIDNELMLVTAVAGTTWTITRAVEGTTAATHASGAAVNHFLTTGALNQLFAEQTRRGVLASVGAATKSGNLYYPTNSYYDVIHDDGATLQYFIDGRPVTPPPAAANWTLIGGGNATLTDVGGGVSLSTTANNIGTLNSAIRAVPTAPYTITFLTQHFDAKSSSNTDTSVFSIGWANGTATTSAIHIVRIYDSQFDNTVPVLNSATWTNYSFAGGANSTSWNKLTYNPRRVWWQLIDDNTNRIVRFSTDGIQYFTLQTLGRTTPFTATHYGIFACMTNTNGTPWAMNILSCTIT